MKPTAKTDPFKNLVLDKEEQEIEHALERGEFVESEDAERIKNLFQEAAREHVELRKSKRITLRVNYEDLLRVKAKAKRNRIPYQTLLGSLIHQYAEDRTHLSV